MIIHKYGPVLQHLGAFMPENVIIGSATVGSRGQIVLPVNLRKECDIKPGDTLIVMSRHGMGGPSMVLFKASSLAGVLEDMEATGKRVKYLIKRSEKKQVMKSSRKRGDRA